MRNNTTWRTTCIMCNSSISNVGSGRPKKYCGNHCKAKHERRKAQMRLVSRKRHKPAQTVSSIRANNRQLLNAWKHEQSECALHQFYNNGERKYVVVGLEYLFDMDHIDRTKKHKNIAKMMGNNSKLHNNKTGMRQKRTVEDLIEEMSKCQLVCAECHRRKTVEQREWVSITKPLEPMIVKIYNQPSLFDIDPT